MSICLSLSSRKEPKTKYILEVTDYDQTRTEKRSYLFGPQHKGPHSSVHSRTHLCAQALTYTPLISLISITTMHHFWE